MKDIPEFKIDKWIQTHGATAKVALHGSNVSALSLGQLQQLAVDDTQNPIDHDLQLTYGTARGSLRLRERIAELHSSENVKLTADNVVVTPGSIMANYLALTNLCGKGDHVICQYPTFAQLYVIPRFQGAEVALWRMRQENNWMPKLDELEAMIQPKTRIIIINNPNNPTGAVLPTNFLRDLVTLATKHNITLYSDEVFRPLFHTDEPAPEALASLGYARSVSTGSVSKAHGLPGIRVGWIVSPDVPFLERVMVARDYTTIAVSQLDDGVAAFTLSKAVVPRLMERNLGICKESIEILGEWVKQYRGQVQWIPSKGAGTAFVRLMRKNGSPVDDAEFALWLIQEKGLSVVPGGRCFGDGEDEELKGFVRITLGEATKLKDGLKILGESLRDMSG